MKLENALKSTKPDRDYFALEMELLRRKASKRLYDFLYFTNGRYEAAWHHKYIADQLDNFFQSDDVNKLMLFVPPQHGKSEIASRAFPAYVLGRNPDTKIAACSYSIDLARSFNRDVQRIMESPSYLEVFPKTRLNSDRVAADSRGSYLRNTEEFEVVGYRGSYKAVGVMGGLSGRRVDLAIIDDPVKDAVEANSPIYRQRVWEWYVNVLETRLHNKSKVILIMTRWHEDDLAGRLLENQPGKWHVISIPAIREDLNDPNDPRQIGEVLWAARHDLEKLNDFRKMSEVAFSALYQQRPAPAEGNKVKREWFQYCHEKEVPLNVDFDLWIDGAYTKQTENDPTGLMVAGHHKPTNTLYIRHAHDARLEMPELLALIPEYANLHQLGYKSQCYLEPKASGKSLRQMLNKVSTLNSAEIDNHLVSEGKEARIQVASPKIQAGRVVLIRGSWNDRFVTQICTFPNAVHDEYVDLIGYACFHYFDGGKRRGVHFRDFSEFRV